mgnify:CR=1 FL=1
MPNSTIVGYARVSSVDQNLDRQLVQLKTENVEKLFIDKVSGKNLDRPGFSAMMEYVREGDLFYGSPCKEPYGSVGCHTKIAEQRSDHQIP